ncbi:MAG: DNA repair protein RadC [Peptococcaceae bacterium]|nr:DNA repair protein RadC [Peptococcaceae bacterium]
MNTSQLESLKIKDRPPELQPREKLILKGAQQLTETELLAILLRTGTAKCDVLELAQMVLEEAGGLEGLLCQDMKALCAIKGIGQTKACTLMATIEIGRRLVRLGSSKEMGICDSFGAAAALRENFHSDEQESFHVLYLDARNKIIDVKELFRGTVNGTNVHPRDIFREAVRLNAVGLIVGHNHPSGDLTPSREDLLLTKRVREGAALLGLSFLDHIILGGMYSESYFSFKDAGYLE